MRDPATLSTELFTAVLRAITLPQTSENCPWDQETLTSLRACSLINRTWHAHTLPIMYQTIHYDGRTQSFERLWLYTRTLIENASIGLFVQHATFWHCFVDHPWSHRTPYQIPRSDRLARRESRAIMSLGCEIGFRVRDLSSSLLTFKSVFPLMPMIISKLPNLKSLSLDLKESEDYHYELDKVLAVPGSFPMLRDVIITLRPCGRNEVLGVSLRRFRCYTPRVIFSKEWVRKLVINGAEFRRWQDLDAFEEQRVSNVTHLSLKTSSESNAAFIYSYLPRILRLPRMLVSLNLSVEVQYKGSEDISHDDYYWYPTCHDIWTYLDMHKEYLNHLDFQTLSIPWPAVTTNPRIHQGSQMGSLKDFPKLESLSVRPEALLGHSTNGEGTQEQLKDKLPKSLVSLYLYADESLATDPSMEQQMLDVVTFFVFCKA